MIKLEGRKLIFCPFFFFDCPPYYFHLPLIKDVSRNTSMGVAAMIIDGVFSGGGN